MQAIVPAYKVEKPQFWLTPEETVKKFIKWICNKFELPSEDEIVRNFEKETGNSLNAEKQFAKKERIKEFEKEL